MAIHERDPSSNDEVDPLCLLAPWWVLHSRKGKYSFLELWIFITVWGFSAGPLIIGGWLKNNAHTPGFATILFWEYLSFHGHCAIFVAVIDTLNWRSGPSKGVRAERIACLVFSQLAILFVAFCLTGAYFH
jgi:hypothetical protein